MMGLGVTPDVVERLSLSYHMSLGVLGEVRSAQCHSTALVNTLFLGCGDAAMN